jgi:hypothetical protein
MSTLTRQRCFTHPLREAAARCPSCGRFFCRECVTEHDGRLVCAACLRSQLAASAAQRTGPGWLWKTVAATRRSVQFVCCLGTAWFFFHLLGQMLLTLPDQFHEGTFWDQINKLQGNEP